MAQRLNFLIVLILPFVLIGAVKATNSLLPERYYFSFSSLAGQSGSPFIVSQPTIAIAEACRIAKKYQVDIRDLRFGADCTVELERSQSTAVANEFPLSPTELDALYSHFLRLDPQTSYTLKLGLTEAPASVFQLPPNKIEAALSYAATRQSAIEQLRTALTNHIEVTLNRLIVPEHAKLDQIINPAPVAPRTIQSSNQPPALTVAERDQIRRVFEDYQRSLTPKNWADSVGGLQKSDIDRTLAKLESSGYASRTAIKSSILANYIEPIKNTVVEDFNRGMTNRGVEPFDMVNVKRQLGTQMAISTSPDYFIAGFIRILPILVVSAAIGFWLGRLEVMSIGFAAGFAALLLSWPILLLWDTVVGSEWTAYRPLFVAFYAAYVLVFFFVGRSGALIGSFARERLLGRRPRLAHPKQDSSSDAASVSLGTVARDVTISLAANGVMLLLNLAIPLVRIT